MLTLIKNAHIYAPDDLGVKDILIAGEKIERIAPKIELPKEYVNVIDICGMKAVPGYIDQHVHIIGGGGEAGFHTRAPEIGLSELIKAGITTVIGLLGTDSETRSVENLLAKTKALNNEGMTAYCLTGAYSYPSPSLTGSVKTDITFIDEIIGVKLAISDHRASFLTYEDLAQLSSQARVAGMIADKAGTVTLHMGDDPSGLKLVKEVLKNTSIPMKHFIPTHCNRNPKLLEEAIEYLKDGGNVDLTAGYTGNKSVSEVIAKLKKEGIYTGKLTFTTDGNGSWSRYDSEGNLTKIGVSSVTPLHEEVVSLVENYGFTLSEALVYVTVNVANMLDLQKKKGQIKEGLDADFLLLEDDLSINSVFMRGKCMMKDNELLKKGTFEK